MKPANYSMPSIPNSPLLPAIAAIRHSLRTPSRVLRIVAAGVFLGLALPGWADNIPDIQRLIKQGSYPQALEKVDAYLASRPKDAQGRFLKGIIYTEMNRVGDAITVFSKLTEDYPELPEPYNNLAVLHAQQKQYDKARAALEMAIRTHPSYAVAYENLGDIYAKLASQAYDKALQLDSANSATQNKLALIRDLITTSGRGNVKPTPPAPAATTAAPTAPTARNTPAAPTTPASSPSSAPAAPKVAPAPATPAASTTLVTTTPGKAGDAGRQSADPASAKNAAIEEDVLKALNAWANAWMKKDMKAYFAAYASDFAPPKGVSRKAWEEEREQRIAGKPGNITVAYDKPRFTIEDNLVTVKFRQQYKAPGISTSASKVMVFTRSGSKWLIKEEKSR